MSNALAFYTVDEEYVDYLVPHTPHLFHNAKASQTHSRKYIGVVLSVSGHTTSPRSRLSKRNIAA